MSFPPYVDARGTLIPVELGDLPFEARRVFVVSGPPEGSTRGGHEVSCRELVLLVSGRAEVRVDDRTEHLDAPGATLLLRPGEVMSYDLAPGGSTIVVFADEPWPG